MSCGLHDVARVEARGVPTVLVATRPFADEAEAQSRVLGLRGYRVAWVDHPVQTLTDGEVAALARQVLPEIQRLLTEP